MKPSLASIAWFFGYALLVAWPVTILAVEARLIAFTATVIIAVVGLSTVVRWRAACDFSHAQKH